MSRRPIRNAITAAGRAIGQAAFWVAPGFVGKRIAWKNALAIQKQMLASREAVHNDRFRGLKWITSRLSPDSEAEEGLANAQDRSRDLSLNDPVAAGYVKGRVTNVVATGLSPQARIRPAEEWEPQEIDEDRARRLNKQLESAWERWQKKASRCGRKSFWMLQRLAERCVARDGECLVVLSDKPFAGRPVPLCLEVVSITRLETPLKFAGDPRVRMGIETDEDGTPVAYHIRTTDPNDTTITEMEWERVPADRVCHIYEEEEGGQHRGWPASVPSMTTMKDVKDYDEAVLIKRQTEACFAAFIKGGGNPYDAAVAAATGTNANSQRLEEITPGMIRYLGTNEDVTFATPGQGSGGDHAEYQATQYHRVAAGLGYPYELLLKTYGGTNYSSGRLSLLDGRAEFRAEQKFQIDLFLSPVWERFVYECVLAGLVEIDGDEYQRFPWAFNRHIWIPPGWPWVDPVKEVLADGEAVDRGFASRTQVNQARGTDDEEVQEQRLREKMLDADNEKRLRDYRAKLSLDEPGADGGQQMDGEGQRAATGVPPTNRISPRELFLALVADGDGKT